MKVTIEWPDGQTAVFDGDTHHWTSYHKIFTGQGLDGVATFWSVTVPKWEYWTAKDVAEEVGARIVDPPTPPTEKPTAAFDVGPPPKRRRTTRRRG